MHPTMISHKILHCTYSTLAYLALPIVFGRLAIKGMKAPAYYKRLPERLGFTSFPSLKKSIWIHAVSVGEVIAALPIIKHLHKAFPNLDLVVTTTTPTGSERVLDNLDDSMYHTYLPYDLPGTVDRFLKSAQPILAIIMETEIWPNLFLSCARKSIPIVMANARLSPSSFKRYQNIRSFITPVLNSCRKVLAQSRLDEERFLNLGVDPNKLLVCGNIKFDIDLSPEHMQKGEDLRHIMGKNRKVWIAASTHAGEEELILKAHSKILKEFPNALLILVPRHPERFDSVAELCSKAGFSYHRRSQNLFPEKDVSVYLGDTMGELPFLYAASDLAFVGGSMIQVGGHNLLEPAALNLPILTGQYLFNFSEVADKLLENNALIKIQDGNQLSESLFYLFKNPHAAEIMGNRAREVVENNKGSLFKTLKHIQEIITHKNGISN